jgi:hypothetical protein
MQARPIDFQWLKKISRARPAGFTEQISLRGRVERSETHPRRLAEKP